MNIIAWEDFFAWKNSSATLSGGAESAGEGGHTVARSGSPVAVVLEGGRSDRSAKLGGIGLAITARYKAAVVGARTRGPLVEGVEDGFVGCPRLSLRCSTGCQTLGRKDWRRIQGASDSTVVRHSGLGNTRR